MGLSIREKKLLTQFASNNYGLYNKTLAKKIGLHESIFLGEIISEYDYWNRMHSLTDDGYFYSTVENVMESTTLSDYQQRSIIKHLVELKILNVKVAGMPAKRYFRINEEQFYAILLEDDKDSDNNSELTSSKETCYKDLTELTTSSKESKEQDLNSVKTNNNNIPLTNKNNNIVLTATPFINNSSKVSNLLENETKQLDTKPKKKSNLEQCTDLTFELISDSDLAEYVNNYLVDQKLYKSINVTQWKMRLEHLLQYAKGRTDLAKEIVKQTWARGYRDFYPVSENYVNTAKPAYTAITRKEIKNDPPKIDDKIVF
jgi:hypothetical protein|nr:MAG TPA: hypothetical protein [Caudoviricetes sp.]